MADAPDPRSGLDAEGNWTPAFPGQRPPLEPGNTLPVTHGARSSVLRLTPRATEISDTLREAMPLQSPAFEPALAAAGFTGARLELAMTALLEAEDPEDFASLDDRARSWTRLWLHCLGQLGLTPSSATKLGLDLARVKGAAAVAYLREKRAAGETEGADRG